MGDSLSYLILSWLNKLAPLGGYLEGVKADISYPLKYLFRFKISTNDSGTQRKFLSR